MAIGTTAAIIGSAVIGAGAGIIGSSKQAKANKAAAETQDRATEAQLQLGRESLSLNKDIYNANYGTLSPFVGRGNVAGDQINALLGLPQAPAMQSPLAAPAGGAQTNPAYSQQPIGGNQDIGIQPGIRGPNSAVSAFLQRHPQFGNQTGVPLPGQPTPTVPSQPAGTPTTTPTAPTPQLSPLEAMNRFSNSAGMQFALQRGADQINNGAASNGWLQSGAALKALQQNGQDIALQQYFPMYTGLLGQQQAVGAGAASSIAGVGANFGNTAANINSGMGNAINSGAQNIGNLQLANGQNQANMWGSLGSSFGSILGAIK